MKTSINWAILAPGLIANSMAAAITGIAKTDRRIKAYAVASRDLNRSRDFAEKWGFEKFYGSYDELFLDDKVDVIYVANPHAFHFESVMKALENGKNVLCEKPAGCNLYQLEKMIEKAREKNLFFMEAMWTAFNPCVNQIVKAINDGKIGKVKHIESHFCNRLPFESKSRLYAPELAGGALLDLGIYNIYFSMKAANSKNVVNHSSSVRMVNGIDAWNGVNLEFDNGVTANFQSACDQPSGSNTHDAIIFGEKGFITAKDFFMCQKAEIHAYKNPWGNDNEITEIIERPFGINGYEYEMIEVTDLILQGKTESSVHSHADSVALCKMMDALRKDWKMTYPFETDEKF